MQYNDFHELIIQGHAARLTPEEIHQRFIEGGLPPQTVPPARMIRVIGCNLIGPACRWRAKGKMTAWSSGAAHRDKHLNGTRRKILL